MSVCFLYNLKFYSFGQELEDDELFNDVFGSPERLAEIADDWEHDPDNPDPEHFS